MRIRSLPHFSHKPIGKTTHKKGMSYAHVNYITRDDACSKTLAGNMPADREGARPYFEREAAKDGVPANARIADTLIIALPLELTREQRHEAIERFMEKIGKGRIAWIAAFHDKGKDEHNPHCHLIFRDADIETGRKVVGTTTSAKDVKEATERGWKVPPRMTTKDLRVTWCEHLNAEMERHRIDVRFDQRKLKERGIDKEPEIHIGPKANSMSAKDRAFFSQDRRRGDHANVYTLLDAGSRAEYNAGIIERNRQRDKERRDGQEASIHQLPASERRDKMKLRAAHKEQRKSMYAEQKRDRDALRAAQDAEKLQHQKWARAHYAKAREAAFQEIKMRYAEAWVRVRDMSNVANRTQEATTLRQRQKDDYARTSAKLIEAARPEKNAAWEALKSHQEAERRQLALRHSEESAALSRQQISERQALHLRWQGHHHQKQAQKIGAGLQNSQSMPAVQTNAVKMMKQHARAEEAGLQAKVAGASPLEAGRIYTERARTEAAARNNIRHELNTQRVINEARATADRKRAGGKANPRHRADAHNKNDAQEMIQQTVKSGQTVTDADRANASPHVKAALDAKERGAKIRRSIDLFTFVQQKSGRDRNGGRSGR